MGLRLNDEADNIEAEKDWNGAPVMVQPAPPVLRSEWMGQSGACNLAGGHRYDGSIARLRLQGASASQRGIGSRWRKLERATSLPLLSNHFDATLGRRMGG